MGRGLLVFRVVSACLAVFPKLAIGLLEFITKASATRLRVLSPLLIVMSVCLTIIVLAFVLFSSS